MTKVPPAIYNIEMKKGWKVIGRKMPPKTDSHIQKLRESNLKTWADPLLRKKQSQIAKKGLANMSFKKREKWMKNIRKASQRPENRERARQIMINLRQDPEWLKNSMEKQKQTDKNGIKNPFYNKKHTVTTRKVISKTKKESEKTPRGKDNKAYIDGKGNERKTERLNFSQTLEYKLFVEKVLKRDKYTCQLCGVYGVKFHVDHIKSYKDYPKLRTTIKNGRTLCIPCHKKTPNFGRKKYEKVI